MSLMDSTCIAIIVILVILVGLSAWCSSTETAYSSVNKVRLKNKAEDGNPRAQNALDLLEKYDKVLSCILIGNNIVNLTAATLGTVLFTKLLGPVYGPAASTVVLTIIVLIFGEITPKTLANDQAETFCMRAAPALRVCLVILTPLHLFFSLFQKAAIRFFRSSEEEGITEEELITMVEEAENEGGLEHHESELIRAAIEFNDMEVEISSLRGWILWRRRIPLPWRSLPSCLRKMDIPGFRSIMVLLTISLVWSMRKISSLPVTTTTQM